MFSFQCSSGKLGQGGQQKDIPRSGQLEDVVFILQPDLLCHSGSF